MFGIIKTILIESKYENNEIFNIEVHGQTYEILSLVSQENKSQVFLLIQILESDLLESEFIDVLPTIAATFKDTQIYEPEMEKNTSLVICVKKDIDSQKLVKAALVLEDNPYYFKKYLYSFYDDDKFRYEQLKSQYECNGNIEFLQKYVLDSRNFEDFKNNTGNNRTYKMISDLLVKLPFISIGFSKDEELLSVHDIYQDEVKEFGKEKLEKIINLLNSEMICSLCKRQ